MQHVQLHVSVQEVSFERSQYIGFRPQTKVKISSHVFTDRLSVGKKKVEQLNLSQQYHMIQAEVRFKIEEKYLKA